MVRKEGEETAGPNQLADVKNHQREKQERPHPTCRTRNYLSLGSFQKQTPRIQVQIVTLRGDPRKHWSRRGENRERNEDSNGRVSKPVSSVGD